MVEVKKVTDQMVDTAIRLYDQLLSESSVRELEQGTFTVFSGSLLQQFEKVSTTRQYYTPCYKLLEVTNSITRIDTGGRSGGSLVVLHGAPVADDLRMVDPLALTTDPVSARLVTEAHMKDLLKSFQGLDVVQALGNHEERIATLESQIDKLTKTE